MVHVAADGGKVGRAGDGEGLSCGCGRVVVVTPGCVEAAVDGAGADGRGVLPVRRGRGVCDGTGDGSRLADVCVAGWSATRITRVLLGAGAGLDWCPAADGCLVGEGAAVGGLEGIKAAGITSQATTRETTADPASEPAATLISPCVRDIVTPP